MLSKCDIHNVDGTTVYSIDSDPVSTGFSTMTRIHVTSAQRAITDRDKMQAHGVWPTKTYRGGMSLEIEGSLQADTPAHALTQLESLTRSLFGLPDDAITNARKHGFIQIRRLDKTEDWKTDFVVLEFSPDITAETTRIAYLLTLFSWNPWFVGVTSGNKFYWS